MAITVQDVAKTTSPAAPTTSTSAIHKVLSKKLEGLSFHSQMIEMCTMLGLCGFAEYQKHQMIEEMKSLESLKEYLMKKYHKVYLIEMKNERFYHKETLEELKITEENVKAWLSKILILYKDWECDVVEILETGINETMSNSDKQYLICLLKEVEEELCDVRMTINKLEMCDYCHDCIMTMNDNLYKKYKGK